MKTIPLTKGYVAMVDDEDYEMVSGYKWYSSISSGIVYAKHMLPVINGRRQEERMHQLILGTKSTEYVDHIDGNGLNNQRNNLRIVTHRENCMNRHARKLKKRIGKYPGITWAKRERKWIAQAQVNGIHKHIGSFDNQEDAYRAYIEYVAKVPNNPIRKRIYQIVEKENYVRAKK